MVQVNIDASQAPDRVRADLLASLRAGEVNAKFHYDSVKQTQKWLALHQIYSPTRHDENCREIYERAFAATASRIATTRVDLIGLGCGGGQKDTRLLARLAGPGRVVNYVPGDVALAMALTARQTALAVVPPERCFPLVFDLATAADLPAALDQILPGTATRVFTFLGMIPNFQPGVVLPRLAELIQPGNLLIFSANLAPGADYAAGVRQILPQYDNAPTQEWLLTFLLDLGVERPDGELRFAIETDAAADLHRVVARFHFVRECRLEVAGEVFTFAAGASLRLFFSYRYTVERARRLLGQHGFVVHEAWLTDSAEEAVFLCERVA